MSDILSYQRQINAMREFFNSEKSLSIDFRKKRLLELHSQICVRQKDVEEALYADLGKCPAESWLTEIGEVLTGLRHTARKIQSWSKARLVWPDRTLFPAYAKVYPEPFGLALIFSPWNYPFQLSLLPLIAAIGAGNCVILKPSRRAPKTGKLLKEIIASTFEPEHCQVILDDEQNSDPEATAGALLKEHFDFIFYTGSARVGHTIMAAASSHLTPICLELGGQSPVIVAKDANIEVAAKRIAWGKILNAGQTCVAPDYIWANKLIKHELKELIDLQFQNMLGADPLQNPDYAHIISKSAFDRLCDLGKACDIELQSDEKSLKISPIIFDATSDSPALAEEIFGPLLPLLEYEKLEEAILQIKSKARPLACYIFTSDKKIQNRLLRSLSFGGGCINDVVLQAGSHNLPFGGVGKSGMGRYHGRAGFDLFSNMKSVVHQYRDFDLPLRYPPYTKKLFDFIKWFLH